tara:strand:- start:31 stop:705 length:675 start_codon:yes stop_codon:yes gene_type:complete
MAETFETLGAGNGFSSCLAVNNKNSDQIVLNPPSLEQTMSAYWNFLSATFGGATFAPGNEPKDLICNPNANTGGNSNGDSSPNQNGLFAVSHGIPTIFVVDGVKYYNHGIGMTFNAVNTSTNGGAGQSSRVSVVYQSTIYQEGDNLSAYECVNETAGEPPEIIGKSAYEKTQDVSSVTISGIPFIKIVEKTFSGTLFNGLSGPCPLSNYPSIPSGDPTLALHTY